MSALRISGLRKDYLVGAEAVPVLKGIDLDVPEGDYVAIMGPSGSGKSTLLNVLGCLDHPTAGHYWLGGQDVAALNDDEVSQLRGDHIGFVFQSYNLIPQLTVIENIATPLEYRAAAGPEELARCQELAERVGLGTRLDHRATQLSGGQQQRVGIARSLVNAPAFILADEPTGNLDTVTTAEILNLLDQLNGAGKTIVMVTHEDEVAHRARRIVRLRDGVIVSDERLRPPAGPPVPALSGPGAAKAGDVGTEAGITVDPAAPLAEASPRTGMAVQPKLSWRSSLEQALKPVQLGFRNLILHPLRSALTVLGMFIGVASVIWLMAIGEGIGRQAMEQIEKLGASNIILRTVAPSTDPGQSRRSNFGISVADYGRLRRLLPSIVNAVPMQEYTHSLCQARGHMVYARLLGCTEDYAPLHQQVLKAGRFLSSLDMERKAKVCVLSQALCDQLFRIEDPLGQSVQLNGDFYRVVGISDADVSTEAVAGGQGRPQAANPLMVGCIPLSTYYTNINDPGSRATDGGLSVDQVTLVLRSQQDVLPAADLIRSDLERTHRDKDYEVIAPLELLEQARSTRLMFMAMLGLVAAISLLVGGIGIMNIMLATVTERTREIGIRRALGARRRDITRQFLAETAVLSGVGGAVGILVGLACSPALTGLRSLLTLLFPKLLASAPETIRNLDPVVVPWSLPLAAGISLATGVLFGLYPARRAAAMHPIDALRHVN
ncbi:MAG: Macrolide export ATP-binding/permease protein MacB [Verrucomicrobiales bacterium]|nr:Macrolide export ATP-binding/permease protein MacB [Verrucomicrobiales bacterium]